MTGEFVIRPALSLRVAAGESRTEAFSARHFGFQRECVALDISLPSLMNASQCLAAETLIALCLRMDPMIREVRVPRSKQTQRLVIEASMRLPLQFAEEADRQLPAIAIRVGPGDGTYVDASDWQVGFDMPARGTTGNVPAGAILAGLEGAKYVYLEAIRAARGISLEQQVWPGPAVFDCWQWASSATAITPTAALVQYERRVDIALVGCGGVGAGYLWFLRNCPLTGHLLLIDPDVIAWHNMNRLLFAETADAESARAKVVAAANFMASRWAVHPLARHAEHTEALEALRCCAANGGLLACAVGEPETRKLLARRGFDSIFDAATNSDGSAQLLALRSGVTSCIDCHLRTSAPINARPCGLAETAQFAGVVPQLAAYAGALLGIEQLRVLLGAEPLMGANTQSVLLPLDAMTRVATRPCQTCFFAKCG